MTLKLRFALLLGSLLGGFVLMLVGLRQLETNDGEEMLQRDRQSRAQLLAHWLDATSRTLPQVATDLAEAAELATAVLHPEGAAAAKLPTALATAGVGYVWILSEAGAVRAAFSARGHAPASAPPLGAHEFTELLRTTPNPRFFAQQGSDLLEICVRAMAAPVSSRMRGWVVVARLWNEQQLRSLADLTESRVTIAPPRDIAAAPDDRGHVVLVRPLADWQGNPLRTLRVDYAAPEIERALAASRRQSHVFIAFGLLLLGALGLALHSWVIQPLRQIEHSLGAQDPQAVSKLTAERSELGRVAGLVVTSFRQRAALEREIAERTRMQAALERTEASLRENLEQRARLGRDLHDGVIQSLYAAGMGLAGIRMQLHPEQTEAAARLEQTRAALNETIHDVRNFIIGLEPEALKLQTFSQAVAALLEAMRGVHAFRSSLEVDETLAARLTLAQRVHALQIAREAVSNAARHGAATHVHVSLRLHDSLAEFQVADDGCGFDMSAVPPGKGLGNFAERARELGGELILSSEPGKGTRVRLTFALPIL